MSDTPVTEKPEIVDEVAASSAPLLDHLNELRSRLIKSIAALFVATIICFFFAQQIYEALLMPFANVAEKSRGTQLEMIFTGQMEFFFAKLRLSLFGGIFVAFPFLAWQIYAFIAPGLYKNERGAFWPYLVMAPILFALGASFVYFVMLPMIAQFSLNQEVKDSAVATIRLLPRVSEYLSLTMALMLAFGISFQLPIVLTLLAKVGVVTADLLKKGRKYALVGILVFSAIFTPPDAISQVLMTVPVYLLYEISIFCVKMIEGKRDTVDAAS